LQYYSPDEKYSKTDNGVLTITATDDDTGDRKYTSARLSTQTSATFKHGLFAARMKMPEGQGIWPAFWLFGTGAKYSEIDIAELVGGDGATKNPPTSSGDDRAAGTLIHFATEDGGPVTKGPGCSHHLPNNAKFSEDYHVFWLEWTETEVWSGVDSNDRQLIVADISQLDAFKSHMFLILNIAVGGSFPGPPDSTTNFPQTLEVDWVRVWAKDGEDILAGGSTTPPNNPADKPPTTTPPGTTTPPPSGGTNTKGNSASAVGTSIVTWVAVAVFSAIAVMCW
jgi:beta-glucanase (GH16 family)